MSVNYKTNKKIKKNGKTSNIMLILLNRDIKFSLKFDGVKNTRTKTIQQIIVI